MADMLRVKASVDEHGLIAWEMCDNGRNTIVRLEGDPGTAVNDGDEWFVDLVDSKDERRGNKKVKVVTVHLVALYRQVQAWENIEALDGHYIEPRVLKTLLIAFHGEKRHDVILSGPSGTGKTQLGYALARTLCWQDPLKFDMGMMTRSKDLFGSDAARKGETYFAESPLYTYLMRAWRAHREGIDTRFLVILDEINRLHAKSSQGMQGLFDDTRQVSITTAGGARTIVLPPNVSFIGTMNVGYAGTFELDNSMKSRFVRIRVHYMPFDEEVRMLTRHTSIPQRQATIIVSVATALRKTAESGELVFAPDFRKCLAAASFVRHGLSVRDAILAGMLDWYDGDTEIDTRSGQVKDPNTQFAKAFSAIRSQMGTNG